MVGNCVTHYWLANKVRRTIQVFSLVHFGCSFHFSNSNPPQTPNKNNHRHQGSFLFNLHPSPHFPHPHKTTQTQRHPHGPEGWGCSWPTRRVTQRSLHQRLHHDQIPAPSTLSFSLSNYSFFNKIYGICVILGYDFEIRGRIMS